MTDNRTTELLRGGLTERGIEWRSGLEGVTFVGDWCFVEYDNGRLAATCEPVLTPEQAVAATLGNDRNEIYNAGFDNGVKSTLQQLDGLLIKTDSAVEIQAWVDEQWKEYTSGTNIDCDISLAREEIVRCRDCKWRYVYKNVSYCDLDYAKIAIKPDNFCAWGERKEVD